MGNLGSAGTDTSTNVGLALPMVVELYSVHLDILDILVQWYTNSTINIGQGDTGYIKMEQTYSQFIKMVL